jgi:hypothetical protein
VLCGVVFHGAFGSQTVPMSLGPRFAYYVFVPLLLVLLLSLVHVETLASPLEYGLASNFHLFGFYQTFIVIFVKRNALGIWFEQLGLYRHLF